MQVKLIDKEAAIYLVDQLEQFEKDKAIKSGLRAAVNVFRIKGKSNLRARLKHPDKGTNHLMNSFTTKVKRNKLGALAGFDKWGRHSHLVDSGSSRRPHPITGNSGVMPSNNFWSDSHASEEGKAMDVLYKVVENAVQRINSRR